MQYELIPLMILLAVQLMIGMALILDAGRRVFRSRQMEKNHDVHA